MGFQNLCAQIDSLTQQYYFSENSELEKIEIALSIVVKQRFSGKHIPLVRDALGKSLAIGHDSLAARCNEFLGFMYYYDRSMDSSIFFYTKGFEHYSELNLPDKATQMIKDRGLSKHKKGLFSDALADYQMALLNYQKQSDTSGISTMFNRIGGIHRDLKKYDSAIEYYQKSFELAKRLNLYETMCDASGNQGIVFQRLDSLDLAIRAYTQTLELSQEHGLTRRIGTCYTNLGALYLKKKEYGEASYFLDQAYEIYGTSNSSNTLSNIKVNQGKVALATGQLDQAEKDCFHALEIAKRANNLENQKNALQCLIEANRKIGQPNLVIDQLIELNRIQDSLYQLSNIKEVTELEMQFQFDKEQSELMGIQKQKEWAAKWTKYWLIAGLFALAIITYLIFRSAVQRKKTIRLVEAKNIIISKSLQEKDLLLREIHHRVKNNLQVVTSLLSLQTSYVDDPNALEALNEGRDRVQSMALIHQNLYQEENLTGIEIQQYFEKLIEGLFDSYNIEPEKIKLQLNIENLNLDVDTVIPIGLIVNELVSNALKYAFPNRKEGTIKISLVESNHHLVLKVGDNGIGMEQDWSENSKTFGYQLIHAFKDKLEAEMTVSIQNGTDITMKIQDYKKAG